jgi:hypothetical protein
LGFFQDGDVDFWGENGGGDVKMQRLGKIGKTKTSEKRQIRRRQRAMADKSCRKIWKNV